jgi:hypothetical protein
LEQALPLLGNGQYVHAQNAAARCAHALATNSSPERRRCKHIDVGDVRYEIAVYDFDENYRAEWICDRCGESGAWAPISATADGAIELAELALKIHHTLVHGSLFRSSNSRKPR